MDQPYKVSIRNMIGKVRYLGPNTQRPPRRLRISGKYGIQHFPKGPVLADCLQAFCFSTPMVMHLCVMPNVGEGSVGEAGEQM